MDDGMAFVTTESYYKALVEGEQSGDLLLQAFVNKTGHCAFSAEQYKTALAAMESWLDTGVRPDPFAVFLPSKGFDVTFVPDPWIF
jgi:hypothetical protein